jgi:hypothetical protein
MTSFKKLSVKSLVLTITLFTASQAVHAQLEVTQLILKGQSATGFGAYLHLGFPVAKGDEISGEAGFDYFAPGQSHLVMVPLLVGYRHTFDGSGTRFYIEPLAGYTIGGTDIQKVDANGNPLVNSDGSEVDQKVSGPTAGLGFGYIIPSPKYPVNFALRFEHTFVSGDPSPSLLSFRISWSVLTGRRLSAQ